MGRPSLADSKDTRSELTKIALEMIQTKGYNAFSYNDLAERLKIRKASIHYHFPTKEDLGVGLIQDRLKAVEVWQKSNEERNLGPLEQLKAYFDYFTALSQNCTRICPVGALTSEWDSLPSKLQTAVTALVKRHQFWLQGVLEKGRALGLFNKNGSVEEQAQFIYSSIQGALQNSRAQKNPTYFRQVTHQILEALKSEG